MGHGRKGGSEWARTRESLTTISIVFKRNCIIVHCNVCIIGTAVCAVKVQRTTGQPTAPFSCLNDIMS